MILPKIFSSLHVPISIQLGILKAIARIVPARREWQLWARKHLNLQLEQEADWLRRFHWGNMAGEAVRKQLSSDRGREATLALLRERQELKALAQTIPTSGMILVAAHLGPPKFAMHCVMQENWPLMIWSRSRAIELPEAKRSCLRDPGQQNEQSALLIATAAHLRSGGVLFAAPDVPSGARPLILKRLGTNWRFSRGIPALARSMNVPCFLVLALWVGGRVELTTKEMPRPSDDLSEADWVSAWIEAYWDLIEPTILSSPENLRFIRGIDWRAWEEEQVNCFGT